MPIMVQGVWNTMPYCYNDAKCYLTYGPNLSGRAAFGEIVDTLPRTGYAELKRFLKNGISESSVALASECRKLYKELDGGPVKHTVGRLARAAEAATDWIALTD